MPSYKLSFSKPALKDVKKLNQYQKKIIIKKLKYFLSLDDPISVAVQLKEPFEGQYRWRIGPYRVVFDIKGTIIDVLRVEHRRQVYKK